MAGDSTLKKWVKQLRYSREDSARSKTQDGSPTDGAVSADLSQGMPNVGPSFYFLTSLRSPLKVL